MRWPGKQRGYVAIPYLLYAAAAVSAVGAVAAASSQAKASRFNEQVANTNAQTAAAQGAEAARRQRILAYQTTSSARANYGASGVSVEGSPEDVLAQSASTGELDAQTVKYNARLKQSGFQNESTLDGMQASSAQSQGYINAASGALGYGAKGYQAQQDYNLRRTG